MKTTGARPPRPLQVVWDLLQKCALGALWALSGTQALEHDRCELAHTATGMLPTISYVGPWIICDD